MNSVDLEQLDSSVLGICIVRAPVLALAQVQIPLLYAVREVSRTIEPTRQS